MPDLVYLSLQGKAAEQHWGARAPERSTHTRVCEPDKPQRPSSASHADRLRAAQQGLPRVLCVMGDFRGTAVNPGEEQYHGDLELGTIKPLTLESVRGRINNITETRGLNWTVLGISDLWSLSLKHLDERLWLKYSAVPQGRAASLSPGASCSPSQHAQARRAGRHGHTNAPSDPDPLVDGDEC